MVFGQNLTVRLLIGLIPGVALVIINTYVWAHLGGIKNLTMTVIQLPIGISLLIANFIWIGKGLIRKIAQVGEELNNSSNQLLSAAGQASSVSSSLAAGASQQAAAIEETAKNNAKTPKITTLNSLLLMLHLLLMSMSSNNLVD